MKNITLLIMAAGMGSRYGGLKQLDSVGPNGETIIDYSVFDAIRAGFTKVVFIIRRDFEQDFKEKITNKYKNKIQIEFAFQDIHDLPDGYICPERRLKPWGTGHAILIARKFINEPFVAINGDDFYGLDSYKKVVNYYTKGGANFSIVAYKLKNTLSRFGGVSRGVCDANDKILSSVTETHNIQKNKNNEIISELGTTFSGDEPVSMNYWGFMPQLFEYLLNSFKNFLDLNGQELKSEFLIPSVINELIEEGKEKVQVLETESSWFGVTFKEDKSLVVSNINELIKKGVYPHKLF